jgi:cell division protein FtsB
MPPQPQPHCETHDEHSQTMRDQWKAIATVKAKVDNQAGRWIILGLVLVAGLGWLGYSVNLISASTAQTAAAVASIDKTMASYIASSTERINQLVDRVEDLEDEIHDMRGTR